MESLYSTIEISKALDDSKEIIKYYITKDISYGLKITKQSNNSKEEITEVDIQNIVKDEKNIQKILNTLIGIGNDFTQIQYIIEDYTKMHISIIA